MPVNTELKEYKDNLPKWELVDWFVSENIEKLPLVLRRVDKSDSSQENTDRNIEYREGAVLINVTKRTHDGMVGAVYRKAPIIDLPTSIDYLEDDVNGSSMGLAQFSKKVLSNTMQAGRDGLLTDFPEALEDTSAEATRDLKAKIIEYKSNQIINWRVEGGKLSLVVLKETHDTPVDEFDFLTVNQYRELRLVDGNYWQMIWREDENGINQPISSVQVRDFNGNPLKEITFTFVGTINNDSCIDPSLLYSIATINKGHYRNSADLEENSFISGQLTLGIKSSMSTDEWLEANPDGIKVGARKGHFLGDNGGFDSVQAKENQLTDKLMERKEQQMISIGARLLQSGGNEREVAVLSRIGAETATLSSLAHNASEAISQCLEWAEGYMSTSVTESIFILNQDFFPKTFDAQQIMALIQLYDRSRIGPSDLHQNLQQASIVSDERTLEEVEQEAGTINPLTTTV